MLVKRNRVLVAEPNVQSQASLVLLTKEYGKASVEQWLDFRRRYLIPV